MWAWAYTVGPQQYMPMRLPFEGSMGSGFRESVLCRMTSDMEKEGSHKRQTDFGNWRAFRTSLLGGSAYPLD